MDAKQLRETVLDVIRGSLTIRQTVSCAWRSVTIGTAILLDNVEICNDSVNVSLRQLSGGGLLLGELSEAPVSDSSC